MIRAHAGHYDQPTVTAYADGGIVWDGPEEPAAQPCTHSDDARTCPRCELEVHTLMARPDELGGELGHARYNLRRAEDRVRNIRWAMLSLGIADPTEEPHE